MEKLKYAVSKVGVAAQQPSGADGVKLAGFS